MQSRKENTTPTGEPTFSIQGNELVITNEAPPASLTDDQTSLLWFGIDAARKDTGINLEQAVSEMEQQLIRQAFKYHPKDLKGASRWLGLRTPDALHYMMLSRHSRLMRELL